MNNKLLADILFPNVKDISYYEEKYPERNLKENAFVTRFAPSPTGFVHMGSLFAAFISERFAHQTGGIFYLRIEDTDQKRLVENGIKGIIDDLSFYDLKIDEGPTSGAYAPYIQSERKEIYASYVKYLIEQGLAYPCFESEENLETLRKYQEENKLRIGYYGKFAKWRDKDLQEVLDNLEKNIPYVIRLKSTGNFLNKVTLNDLIKGEVTFPENDMDIVLLKKDMTPTYHLAHVIDDHLMHTTHVIRGDEWLSSFPIHFELNKVLNFKMPYYAHIAPLTKKLENGSIRKLSKRYDPECSINYYEEKGIPKEVVKIYLSTIMNSNFESWYLENPNKPINDFKFEFKNMNIGGSLFDLQKLESISKVYFSELRKEKLYEDTLNFMECHNKEFASILKKDPIYSMEVLNIERECDRPRKDLASYTDVIKYLGFMFDDFSIKNYDDIKLKDYDLNILDSYLNYYDESALEDKWLNDLKICMENLGYASNMKDYKNNPSKYKGNIRDFCEVIRIAISGMENTPNLYYLLKLLGKKNIEKRFNLFKEKNSKK